MIERVHRNWGFYEVLSETKSEEPFVQHSKVKKLVVYPGCSLSMQYHNYRNELWFVAEGQGKLDRGIPNTIETLHQGMKYSIYSQGWHRLINHTENELIIYEIQYGAKCEEEDIVRR